MDVLTTRQASTADVRKRISSYHNKGFATAMAFTLVTGARIGEVVAKWKPSEAPARGPTGEDMSIHEFDGKKVAVFKMYIQKRGQVRYRNVPIPADSEYEPFCRPILRAYEKAGPHPVFNFNRNKLRRHAARAFHGLFYDIDGYKRKIDEHNVIVRAHSNRLRLHGLRHIRLDDLINNYRFTLSEASQFIGYSMRGLGLSPSLERYASLQWETYAEKLFRPFKPASNSMEDKR